MLRFFRESVKEFDHVVFPTAAETKTYFTVVLGVIVAMTVYVLFIGTVWKESLSFGRSAVAPYASSISDKASTDLENRLKGSTGSTSTGSVSTGSTAATGAASATGSVRAATGTAVTGTASTTR